MAKKKKAKSTGVHKRGPRPVTDFKKIVQFYTRQSVIDSYGGIYKFRDHLYDTYSTPKPVAQ